MQSAPFDADVAVMQAQPSALGGRRSPGARDSSSPAVGPAETDTSWGPAMDENHYLFRVVEELCTRGLLASVHVYPPTAS